MHSDLKNVDGVTQGLKRTTLYDSRREVCDTWIGDELVTIDVSCLWGQTFANWDSLVDTETAAKIACAVVAVLQSCQSSEVQS